MAIPLTLAAVWKIHPDWAMAGLHLFVGAPDRIPRSVGRVKAGEWKAAWTAGEVEALLSRGGPYRPRYSPDLSGFDLPHRLGIHPDDVVADIGCGTGALEVGLLEEGVQFRELDAIDIDTSSLDILRVVLRHLPGSDRVHPIAVEPGTLGIPDQSVDVMVVDTVQLHQPPEEPDPWALHPEGPSPEVLSMLGTLKAALKPQGHLHVIENLPANMVPEPSSDAVRLPYEAAGFRFVSVDRLNDTSTASGAWYLQFQKP